MPLSTAEVEASVRRVSLAPIAGDDLLLKPFLAPGEERPALAAWGTLKKKAIKGLEEIKKVCENTKTTPPFKVLIFQHCISECPNLYFHQYCPEQSSSDGHGYTNHLGLKMKIMFWGPAVGHF